jgi:hypothetical protein
MEPAGEKFPGSRRPLNIMPVIIDTIYLSHSPIRSSGRMKSNLKSSNQSVGFRL